MPLMHINPDGLARLSRWIDELPDNAARSVETQLWSRTMKVAEEVGEVCAAVVGYTGQNPRKGYTHTREDIAKELLDVAVTALCAYEHLTDNRGESFRALIQHIDNLIRRAGL